MQNRNFLFKCPRWSMLAICEPGARERTELEYRTLLLETGFHEVQVIRLETTRDVIVAKKP